MFFSCFWLSFFARLPAVSFVLMSKKNYPGLNAMSTPGGMSIFRDGDESVMTVTNVDVKGEAGNLPNVAPLDAKAVHEQGQDPEKELGVEAWSPWGEDDDWPQKFLSNYLDKLGVVGAGISLNADMHFGGGVVWCKDTYNDGKILREVVDIPDWNKFKRETGFELAQSELVESLETFYIAFAEILLNNGYKVASVKVLDTPRCRFKKMDAKGRITHVYYGVDPEFVEMKAVPIPIYDPSNPKKYKKYVYPVLYRSFGRLYYPTPLIAATIAAGWGDVAISVPKFIKAVYLNQMSLKYQIKVPLSALKANYKEWDEKGEEDQLKMMLEYKDKIDTALTKPENAGKTVIMVYDDAAGKSMVEIEPIKSFFDSSKELPNNVAANSEMLFALGVDPALVGMNMPGGGDLNGSGGSDKRESRKSKQGNLKRERIVSLQLLNHIAFINGYPEDVYPAYLDVDTSQTMDENPTGKKTTMG